MPIGTIISSPNTYSAYAQVRDEYGGEHTVHQSEIPDDLEEGQGSDDARGRLDGHVHLLHEIGDEVGHDRRHGHDNQKYQGEESAVVLGARNVRDGEARKVE